MAAEPRPEAVTYAAAAVILGSVSLVVTAFWQAGMLQSLDMRTEVERMLAGQRSGFGFTVDGWLHLVKVLGMVCAACAVASAILGWQALQRSQAARIGLLALVVPLVFSGLVVQPIFAALTGVGVVVLWLPRSSAWFRPASARMQPMSEAPPPGPYDPYGQQAPPPYGPPPPYQPPFGAPPSPSADPSQPAGPYADPYANPYLQPQPYAQQYAYPSMIGRAADARPGTVTAAGVITLVLAGLTALGGLLMAIVGHAEADRMYRLMADAGRDMHGITPAELASGFTVFGVGLTVSSLAAVIAAVFVLRRSRAARVLLTVLAAAAIVISLVLITSVVSVVPLAGAIATVVLLYTGGANAWFARRASQPPYPGARWPGA